MQFVVSYLRKKVKLRWTIKNCREFNDNQKKVFPKIIKIDSES